MCSAVGNHDSLSIDLLRIRVRLQLHMPYMYVVFKNFKLAATLQGSESDNSWCSKPSALHLAAVSALTVQGWPREFAQTPHSSVVKL